MWWLICSFFYIGIVPKKKFLRKLAMDSLAFAGHFRNKIQIRVFLLVGGYVVLKYRIL